MAYAHKILFQMTATPSTKWLICIYVFVGSRYDEKSWDQVVTLNRWFATWMGIGPRSFQWQDVLLQSIYQRSFGVFCLFFSEVRTRITDVRPQKVIL